MSEEGERTGPDECCSFFFFHLATFFFSSSPFSSGSLSVFIRKFLHAASKNFVEKGPLPVEPGITNHYIIWSAQRCIDVNVRLFFHLAAVSPFFLSLSTHTLACFSTCVDAIQARLDRFILHHLDWLFVSLPCSYTKAFDFCPSHSRPPHILGPAI